MPHVRRITWARTFRIIRSLYPPIDLFEDIADPKDWEALASVEAKTNPRVRGEIGDLGKVPVHRRVSGPGASYAMSPFVHCSPLRPSRFSDGSYGIYYAGNSQDVALAETIYHHARFMASTREDAGWTSQFRLLVGSVDADLTDVNDVPGVLHASDYRLSQKTGAEIRASGSDGLVWNSVRCPGGECLGAFWPDVVSIPLQSSHFSYHWNGDRVDFVKRLDTGEVLEMTDP